MKHTHRLLGMLCMGTGFLGLLGGCGKGLSSDQLQKVALKPAAASQEQASPEVMLPTPLTASAPAVEVIDAPSAPTMPEASVVVVPATMPIQEFNPVDFPDACNDYIDVVSQCIDVMSKAGLEGTGSMQMQLDEMQASWLKEHDKETLNQICGDALRSIAPALHDLGC